jgi:hypothetical protein
MQKTTNAPTHIELSWFQTRGGSPEVEGNWETTQAEQ